MTTSLLDERQYRELLDDALPVVIRTESEYRRMLGRASRLMEKDEAEISEAEGRLLELLGMLIEEYEDRVHPLPKTTPHKMLAHLLDERGIKPAALWKIIPKSRVSEILSGKRGISKAQAILLAEFLHVPVEMFL